MRPVFAAASLNYASQRGAFRLTDGFWWPNLPCTRVPS